MHQGKNNTSSKLQSAEVAELQIAEVDLKSALFYYSGQLIGSYLTTGSFRKGDLSRHCCHFI